MRVQVTCWRWRSVDKLGEPLKNLWKGQAPCRRIAYKSIVTRNKPFEKPGNSRNPPPKHPDLSVMTSIHESLPVPIECTRSSLHFIFETQSGTGYPDMVTIAIENKSKSALWEIDFSGRIRVWDNVGSSGAPSFCELFQCFAFAR